jgi:hypothetical protein
MLPFPHVCTTNVPLYCIIVLTCSCTFSCTFCVRCHRPYLLLYLQLYFWMTARLLPEYSSLQWREWNVSYITSSTMQWREWNVSYVTSSTMTLTWTQDKHFAEVNVIKKNRNCECFVPSVYPAISLHYVNKHVLYIRLLFRPASDKQ